MDIDMTHPAALEREKEISFDILVEAIEQALLTAYHKTPGASRSARVELDRKTGHVTVCATETDEEGELARASTTTRPTASAGSPRRPRSRSSCSGCATPRTTSSSASSPAGGRHRLRRHPAGPRPAGRAGRPRPARGAAARAASRCRGSSYEHGTRIKCLVICGPQGHARPAGHAVAHATPTWSRSCSRSRSPRSPTAPSRSRRSPARPATAPRSRCGRRSRASTPRAPASARWASGCAR